MLEKLIAFAESWAGRFALAAIITAAAFVVAVLVRSLLERISERLAAFVKALEGDQRRTTAVFLRGVGLRAVLVFTRLLRIGATLAILYIWFAGVVYFVDPSHTLVDTIVSPVWGGVVTVAQTALGFIPNLIVLAIIFVVTRFVLEGITTVGDAVAEGAIQLSWLPAELAVPTRRLVNLGIMLVAVLLALPYIPGSDSKTVQAFSIVLGVLVSFGSSSVVSNLMAGLVLTYSRAFRVGDRVRVGDVVGDVTHLGVFTTRIRTIKDEEVMVPNAVVQSAPWTNYARYARETGVQVSTQVTIGYDVPWRKVHELLIQAALQTEGLEHQPEPYVLQKGLDDFYARYQIHAFCRRPHDLHFIEARLCQNIQDCFFRAGVEICSPHYEAHREGPPVIPDDPSGPPPVYPLPGEGVRNPERRTVRPPVA